MEINGPTATIDAAGFPTGASSSSGADQFSTQLLDALLSLRDGNFAVRLPSELTGVDGKIADAFNDIARVSERRARETARVSIAVGKEGKLKQRMAVPGAVGGWADEVAAVNMLIDDLVWPTTEVTRAVGAVTKGDLEPVDGAQESTANSLEGEMSSCTIGKLVNKMIDQLNGIHVRVSRVAREVGTEGKLGGQAQVRGVCRGTWKKLHPSQRQPDGIGSLTGCRSATSLATSRSRSPMAISRARPRSTSQGEILELKDTIATMVDQLNAASHPQPRSLRGLAAKASTEGRLGGQAVVAGHRGHVEGPGQTTVNIDEASNLTDQVRNFIAEGADGRRWRPRGDLSRKITCRRREGRDPRELKDTISTMVPISSTPSPRRSAALRARSWHRRASSAAAGAGARRHQLPGKDLTNSSRLDGVNLPDRRRSCNIAPR